MLLLLLLVIFHLWNEVEERGGGGERNKRIFISKPDFFVVVSIERKIYMTPFIIGFDHYAKGSSPPLVLRPFCAPHLSNGAGVNLTLPHQLLSFSSISFSTNFHLDLWIDVQRINPSHITIINP